VRGAILIPSGRQARGQTTAPALRADGHPGLPTTVCRVICASEPGVAALTDLTGMISVARLRRVNAAPSAIKIFVMSDHYVVRAGLTMFICPESDLDLVGEAGADRSALPLLRACAPDVVILDLDAGGDVELCTAVANEVPSGRLLMLTAARNAGRQHARLRMRKVGLLFKEAPLQVVLKTLRRYHDDDSSVAETEPSACKIIPVFNAEIHERRIARLTERERQIVSLIGEGLRNDQVAVRLGVAEKTVRNQLSSLFDKLGVNDRLGLAVYAFEHGLLRAPL
jgi:two-component system, NarL family, nitrate/nitrite response regulator NarL